MGMARVGFISCILLAAALAVAVPAPAHAAGLRSDFQRGFTLTAYNAGAYDIGAAPRIRKMAADGSDHAAVFTRWFMDTPASSHIAPDPARTPSDASILRTIVLARAAGLQVTLKPQIGIKTGDWIGDARPADATVFWIDYRRMLLHYADLAQQAGASMLVVGTEMRTLDSDAGRWRRLIGEVRLHFSGKLTYAADFTEFERVPFWDSLDYVGVDAYFALADASNPAPSVDELARAWSSRGYLARLSAVSRRTGKRVVFTEIGYRPIHSAAVHPNEWDAVDTLDLGAQARAYEAFYEAVAIQPWMAGVYWWEANTDEWWVKDYSPLGKPAEQVMARWDASAPPPAAAGTTPPPAGSGSSPQPPPRTTPQRARKIRLHVRLRGRRLHGRVRPFSRDRGGRIRLRVQRRSHGRWHHVRSPRPIRPHAGGRFAHRVRNGHVRVRVLFRRAHRVVRSRWVYSRR